MRVSIPVGILMLICGAGRAGAQNPPPQIAIGFGVGTLASMASDSNGSVPFFSGTLRVDFRRHMAVEVGGGYWADNLHYSFGPATVDGSDSTWETTVNLLARSTGRVAVYGGGGFGFGATTSERITTYAGCPPAATCRNSVQSQNDAGMIVGVVCGVDAGITKRMAGFASLRATGGYAGRGADVGALAGVRVRVR
jgi:Outer membrane protein beta-barrel domain